MTRSGFIFHTNPVVLGGGLLILAADYGTCAKLLRWNTPKTQ